MSIINSIDHQDKKHIEQYYRWNANIYDYTRWAILLGRNSFKAELITYLSDDHTLAKTRNVTEIGCGTGFYLTSLASLFPDRQFIGLDTSPHMLKKAHQRVARFSNVRLSNHFFPDHMSTNQMISPQHVIGSYVLSLNSNPKNFLQHIHQLLDSDGQLHLIDFYHSPYSFVTRWMRLHGVYFHDQILEIIQPLFKVDTCRIHQGYGGLFTYYKMHLVKKS
jgi:SAM-dependent methyltransferase